MIWSILIGHDMVGTAVGRRLPCHDQPEGPVYEVMEHTGELELSIQAPSREEVYVELVRAMGQEMLSGGEPAGADRGGAEAQRGLRLEGDDEALLVDLANELVYLAETEGFVAEQAKVVESKRGSLALSLAGHAGLEVSPLVKAATWHRVRVGPAEHGWRATIVLDV